MGSAHQPVPLSVCPCTWISSGSVHAEKAKSIAHYNCSRLWAPRQGWLTFPVYSLDTSVFMTSQGLWNLSLLFRVLRLSVTLVAEPRHLEAWLEKNLFQVNEVVGSFYSFVIVLLIILAICWLLVRDYLCDPQVLTFLWHVAFSTCCSVY